MDYTGYYGSSQLRRPSHCHSLDGIFVKRLIPYSGPIDGLHFSNGQRESRSKGLLQAMRPLMIFCLLTAMLVASVTPQPIRIRPEDIGPAHTQLDLSEFKTREANAVKRLYKQRREELADELNVLYPDNPSTPELEKQKEQEIEAKRRELDGYRQSLIAEARRKHAEATNRYINGKSVVGKLEARLESHKRVLEKVRQKLKAQTKLAEEVARKIAPGKAGERARRSESYHRKLAHNYSERARKKYEQIKVIEEQVRQIRAAHPAGQQREQQQNPAESPPREEQGRSKTTTEDHGIDSGTGSSEDTRNHFSLSFAPLNQQVGRFIRDRTIDFLSRIRGTGPLSRVSPPRRRTPQPPQGPFGMPAMPAGGIPRPLM